MKKYLFVFLLLLCFVKAYGTLIDGINYSLSYPNAYVDYNSSFIGHAYIPAKIQYNNKTYWVKEIRPSAFSMNPGLTSVTMSEVIVIQSYAFSNCTSLSSITLGSSLTDIYANAFENCRKLTTISFPSKLTTIRREAFKDCINLSKITCEGAPATLGNDVFCESVYENATLYVHLEYLENYKSSTSWSKFKNIRTIEITEKCETPTIGYENGKIIFSCATPNASFVYTIIPSDLHANETSVIGNEVVLTGEYVVTAYAKAEDYLQSDAATKTIKLNSEDVDGDGVVDVKDITTLVKKLLDARKE